MRNNMGGEVANSNHLRFEDCVLILNGEDAATDIKAFGLRINQWKQRLDQKTKKNGPTIPGPGLQVVVVDGVDLIQAKYQQLVKQLMEHLEAKGVRFVLTANQGAKRVVDPLRRKGYILAVKPIPEALALRIALRWCHKERIGYDKDGIAEVFRATGPTGNVKGGLKEVFRIMRDVFLGHHYLSFVSYQNLLFPLSFGHLNPLSNTSLPPPTRPRHAQRRIMSSRSATP
jgi:hypothetical protein